VKVAELEVGVLKVGDLVSVLKGYWDISNPVQYNKSNMAGIVIELGDPYQTTVRTRQYVRVRWSHEDNWERTEALELLSESR
jgi:hypothetical protein